jgi:hypothetical protein
MFTRVFQVTLVFASIFCFERSYAMNPSSCSTLMNNGWYKKYSYQGIDQPLTKATKQFGSSKASMVVFTESSTASLDPGYYTHVSKSMSQATSSWGECSAIALQKIRADREKYIAQNKEEIFREVATGRGEHLGVLATFSLCEKSAFSTFSTSLQSNAAAFLNAKENHFGDTIDQAVKENTSLNRECFSFGS